MKNKKSVMAFSGLLILIFHMWVYVTKSNLEMLIKNTAYLGVDIFFFVSAYSLAKREITNYKVFILSRFKNIYIKYMLFALLQGIYKSFSMSSLIYTISGLQLFLLWGKAFLWFIPTIMLFYLIFPLYQKYDKQNRLLTLIIMILLWLCISYIGTIQHFGINSSIVYNRIPIFLLGYYMSKYNVIEKVSTNKVLQFALGFILTMSGYIIIYMWAYKEKLNNPFIGMFYIILIPACFGLILLTSMIPDKGLIKIIGSCTLEMYAIQMIFGYKLGNLILKHSKNMILNNIYIMLSIISLSIFVHYVYEALVNLIKNKVTKDKINN